MQVVVVMGAVLGTIIYRISVVTVIYGSGEQFLKEHAKIFTSITAAVINLVIIMILTKASSGCRSTSIYVCMYVCMWRDPKIPRIFKKFIKSICTIITFIVAPCIL